MELEPTYDLKVKEKLDTKSDLVNSTDNKAFRSNKSVNSNRKYELDGYSGARQRNVRVVNQSVVKLTTTDKPISKPFISSKKTLYILICNFILVTMTLLLSLDFTFSHRFFYPERSLTFSRVTYVDNSSANIFVRVPISSSSTVRLSYKIESNLKEGNIVGSTIINYTAPTELKEIDDFTTIFKLQNLDSDTKYSYEVILNPGENEKVILEPFTFSTLPLPEHSHRPLFFLSGSCIKPNFPYNFPAFYKPNNRVRGMQAIYDMFYSSTKFQPLDLIIFLDVPYYYGSAKKVYLKFYRQLYADPAISKIVSKTPMLHAYDDHEIVNNWSSHLAHPFLNAITAYTNYQGSGPFTLDSNTSPITLPKSYFSFQHGNVSFFIIDTRRYRSPSSLPDDSNKTMLGAQQLQEVIEWANTDKGKVKFIASSVPLTINWDFFESLQDTWRGYQAERLYLLEQIKDVKNLFFLSGDRHEVSITKLPFGFLEFSLSPINQFFSPFTKPFPEIFKYHPKLESNTTISNHQYDPTLLYYRDGNIKFGTLYLDTAAPKPILGVTVYSDLPGRLHKGNHFEPDIIGNTEVHWVGHTPIVSNFEYEKETSLQKYRQEFVENRNDKNEFVKPILHMFLRLEE